MEGKMFLDGSVNFPGVGVQMEHLMEGIRIFGIEISFSGILIALSLFLGLFISERLAKKTEQNTEVYLDLAIRVILGGVIGARLAYIITHWAYYKEMPEEMFSLRQGEMSFLGALIVGLIISFAYCRRRKISWITVCDTAFFGILAGQIFGKVGDFFGRTALGTYTDSKIAMQVEAQDVDARMLKMGRAAGGELFVGDMVQVHPIFLYEIVFFVVLGIIMWFLHRKKASTGVVFSLYLTLFGIERFVIEFIRLDSMKVLGGVLSLEQVFALVVALFGMWSLSYILQLNRAEKRKKPKYFFKKK